MLSTRLLSLLAAGTLGLAWPLSAAAPAAGSAAAAPRPAYGTFGFDVAGMDRAAAPGDDWIGFANGTYQKNLVIPADKSNYGMFLKLRDLSLDRTHAILELARDGGAPGSEARKVGDYYTSFMDEAAIEAKGIAPLKGALDALAAIADRAQLARAFGRANRVGVAVPVSLWVDSDKKNPDRAVVYLGQGGLGLPDRDYYLDARNPRFKEVREKYLAHVARMLEMAGMDRAPERAKGILDLETRIAQAHWSRAEDRQEEKRYNPYRAEALGAAFPGLDWAVCLQAAGAGREQDVVVAEPSAFRGMASLVASEPLAVWKDYLAYHTLRAAAPYLPKAFVEEDFAFRGQVLSGQPALAPRWKRGTDRTCEALGEAVGKLYVARYFPPEAKRQADLLVKNIIAAMDARLAKVAWMDERTRAAARAKLAAFTPKIGYPDAWRDYTALEVRRGDALGNARRAAEFEFQRNLDKLGRPVDRGEWGMTPMTVNAYANFTWNEIVFPAAILQPPFFDPAADPAVNYGGIGVVIGHEISHHFDDQGRKVDKTGRLADWWTPEDVKRFTALTDKVVKQYAAYEPLAGSHVNGELTLGENMADLAGINVAYDAYHRSLGGGSAPVLDGFTGDQRFFLGFAQVWRSKYRDQALLQQITTNEHTPGFLRPNVVRNVDAWYQAFGVKPGQKLYLAPEDRIRVW